VLQLREDRLASFAARSSAGSGPDASGPESSDGAAGEPMQCAPSPPPPPAAGDKGRGIAAEAAAAAAVAVAAAACAPAGRPPVDRAFVP
jgi:hypothetical protein